MAEESTVERGSNIALGVMFVAILLVVFLLAMVIVINALNTAGNSANGYVTYRINNELGSVNKTGYTLTGASVYGFAGATLINLTNYSSGINIGLGNATTSALGKVTNATLQNWDVVNITYTYLTTNSSTNVGMNAISNNVIGMVVNFFSLMPTIGTILAVVILIAGIVLLIMYVHRMRGSEAREGYTG